MGKRTAFWIGSFAAVAMAGGVAAYAAFNPAVLGPPGITAAGPAGIAAVGVAGVVDKNASEMTADDLNAREHRRIRQVLEGSAGGTN